MRVCLVACSKSKRLHPCSAEQLYNSTLFKASREFALNYCDDWRILSALHGLVNPDLKLSPYNKEMANRNSSEGCKWTEKVIDELKRQYPPGTIFTFLAGEKYIKPLSQPLLDHGFRLANPLKGKSIGKRVQWLNQANKSCDCLRHLDRLYDILHRVVDFYGGSLKTLNQYLSERHSYKRGVYFFYDQKEPRVTLLNQPRIVRIGTHAVSKGAQSTIINRLRQHRGTLGGLGNHRGSIFRLHVGKAILNQIPNNNNFSTWGKGQHALKQVRDSEVELEKKVSEYIGNLHIIGVEIDDDPGPASDRAYIERHAIGLVSEAAKYLDKPTDGWLGLYSDRETIRCSGMWNLNHVGYAYDKQFIDILECHVNSMIGKIPKVNKSIAPSGWHQNPKFKNNANQIQLFDEENSNVKSEM